LLNVKGIGEKIFRSNLDKIVASPVSAVTESVTGSAAKKAAGTVAESVAKDAVDSGKLASPLKAVETAKDIKKAVKN